MKLKNIWRLTFLAVLILFVYIFAIFAASFHSHSDPFDHLTCKLCQISSASDTTLKCNVVQSLSVTSLTLFSKIFFLVPYLLYISPERAPPDPAFD